MTADNQIKTERNDHSYFAMMPNMLDDLLDPYQYRLYAHIKRVCGESGKCWQSTATMAEACKMSVGKVSQVKGELAEMGLITIAYRHRPNGGSPYHLITIVDVWMRNLAHCKTPRSPDEQAGSYSERAGSPDETKKTPLKEDPSEEEKTPPPADSPSNWPYDDPPSCMDPNAPISPQLQPLEPRVATPEIAYLEKSGDPDEDATLWPTDPPAPRSHEPPEQSNTPATDNSSGVLAENGAVGDKSQDRPQDKIRDRMLARFGESLGEMTVHCQEARKQTTLRTTPQEDGDPWADKPLRGFCILAGLDYDALKPACRRNWPHELRKWAETFEDRAPTPQETFDCIAAISRSEQDWKTFETPYQTSFQATMDAMLNRIRSGSPINAKGNGRHDKRAGGQGPVVSADTVVM